MLPLPNRLSVLPGGLPQDLPLSGGCFRRSSAPSARPRNSISNFTTLSVPKWSASAGAIEYRRIAW